MSKIRPQDLRSRKWFLNPDNMEMTALYLERYLNYGLTREELQSGKPIIGIAQTGSDLSPCNRHHRRGYLGRQSGTDFCRALPDDHGLRRCR